jgi:DNA polymerase III epsilon subunit-like protein
MILFFDTETTGLPKNWNAPMKDLDNWPRVIQLGFQVYKPEGEMVYEYSKLIKPDGWVIPDGDFWKENGFSQIISEKEGIPIVDALDVFSKHITVCDLLVAHNMSYDHNVLGSEFLRAKKKTGKVIDKFCTKEQTTDIVKIPNTRGYKWPKLSELHIHLFGHDFEGAHDALDDVKATAKCYFELKKQNLI